MLEDNNYDFNFQASRVPQPGRGKVLPGDELILECEYSTKSRQTPTFGGLSTREEMCLGFILYYPRSALADCRSLPTLETTMKAFGIQKVQGQAFEKLRAFMQDLGSLTSQSGDTLQELLQVLMREVKGKQIEPKKTKILSEEDLLNKPFYTVEEEEKETELETNEFLLPSLVESQSENYRELLPQLLLSLKIQQPYSLQNISVSLTKKFLILAQLHYSALFYCILNTPASFKMFLPSIFTDWTTACHNGMEKSGRETARTRCICLW